jgi:hypothetical protein
LFSSFSLQQTAASIVWEKGVGNCRQQQDDDNIHDEDDNMLSIHSETAATKERSKHNPKEGSVLNVSTVYVGGVEPCGHCDVVRSSRAPVVL